MCAKPGNSGNHAHSGPLLHKELASRACRQAAHPKARCWLSERSLWMQILPHVHRVVRMDRVWPGCPESIRCTLAFHARTATDMYVTFILHARVFAEAVSQFLCSSDPFAFFDITFFGDFSHASTVGRTEAEPPKIQDRRTVLLPSYCFVTPRAACHRGGPEP